MLQRFKQNKGNYEPIRDPYRLATTALNQELAQFMPPQPAHPHRRFTRGDTSPERGNNNKPKFTSNFAPSLEERMRPVKTPPGPPPGAYDVQPKWNKIGTHVMAPELGHKKKAERTPGYAFDACFFFLFYVFYSHVVSFFNTLLLIVLGNTTSRVDWAVTGVIRRT